LLGLVILAVSALGCGDDQNNYPASVGVSGPPRLAITNPTDGSCVILSDEEQPVVRVHIAIENWALRPYGYCGMQYLQCGFAVYLVDGEEAKRSASLVTDVPFDGAASPVGQHVLRVELRNDADEVVLDEVENPLVREVVVNAVEADAGCE